MQFFIGLLAGLFGGLVGVGGGVIMIPLMVGILNLDQHKAHGTSLVALVFTGLAGSLAYGMNGTVDVRAALLIAATAIVTARAGAHFAHALPEWKLKRSFGAFLLFVSILLLVKPYLPSLPGLGSPYLRAILFLLTGVLSGFFSGLMGVGGGSIMVPALVLIAGFEQHLAQGSSLLAMIPAGAAGAHTHWKLGNVRTSLLSRLIPGILIGTYLGGTWAHILPDRTLRFIFSVVLVWTGIRYLRTRQPAPAAEQPWSC